MKCPKILAVLVSLLAAPGLAQDCPNGTFPVDELYRFDNAGDHCLVWNRFNIVDSNGARIHLADPTVLKVDGFYYVTGTTDDGSFYDMANFPIYRSRNLVSWELFNTAFPEAQRTGGLLELNPHSAWPNSPNRAFCGMWAPELYVDPDQPEVIWMTFTAAENRGHGAPGEEPIGDLCNGYYDPGSQTQFQPFQMNSVYVVSIDRTDFLAGKHFADPATGRTGEPRWFTYLNGAGNFMYDGGESLGAPPRAVPTSVSVDQLDYPWVGEPTVYGNRWCHKRDDLAPPTPSPGPDVWKYCSTWMALDSFIFLDPVTGRHWALYTWAVQNSADSVWNGNHIAAHPLLGSGLKDWHAHAIMDVNAAVGHLPLAYRQNQSHPVPPVDPADPPMTNGCVNGNGKQVGSCIAEAPAVYYHSDTGRYYLLSSRNPFGSPAYGIVYRVAANFEDFALRSWDEDAVPEQLLTAARDRSAPKGPSFGHGEIFLGPGDRPFLIFHGKDPGGGLRTVFFKELTFEEDHTILPLTEAADAEASGIDRRQDLRLFIVPRSLFSIGGTPGGPPGEGGEG